MLKKWGAVPFARTNIPQSLLNCSCSNPIYGVTSNPNNLNLSPGGSTGGEAALIGGGGSLWGIGSDMGGSIRVPAHFVGIVGFRATSFRSTLLGTAKSYAWCPGIYRVIGPLTKDVDTMVKFYQVYWSDDPATNVFAFDSVVAPLPFRMPMFEEARPLKMGYFEKDDFFPPVPACQRAVRLTTDILEKSGHTVVRISPISIREVATLYFSLAFQDKGKWLQSELLEDIVDKNLKIKTSYLNPSNRLIKFARFLQNFMSHTKPNVLLSRSNLATNLDELRQRFDTVQEFRRKIVDQWSELKLDAVICPAFGTFALPQEKASQLLYSNYTSMYNILDFPSGIVPVTYVTQQDEKQMETNHDRSTMEGNIVYNACLGGVGLPVGVQIVSLPYRDEICFRIMKEVEGLISFN